MAPIPLLLSLVNFRRYVRSTARDSTTGAPGCQLFGMGGPQMRAAGVEIITDYSEVAVVGVLEIVRHLPSLAAL